MREVAAGDGERGGGGSVGCLQKNGLPLRTREGGYSDE